MTKQEVTKRKLTETGGKSKDEIKAKKPRLTNDLKQNSFKKPIKKEANSKVLPKTTKEKKDLRKQRRMVKLSDSYELVADMKKIWSTLIKEDTTAEVRRKLCSALSNHLKGKMSAMILAHDTTRVVQALFKYGNEQERAMVFDELKEKFVEMSKSKYARFLIGKMLKYGTREQRDIMINSFYGSIQKLIKHSFACKIIDTIYNEYANQSQRNRLLGEFYGGEKTLKEVLESQSSKEASQKILDQLKTLLESCIQKTILMFSLIHRVFLEYFLNIDQVAKSEMIDALGEHLVHMLHTKDGCNVAMECIWFSTAKQRKLIVKSLKTYIQKISCEEYGHLVLLAIFDSVDDTKLVSKAILDELFRSIDDLFKNDYGRKVLTYLMAPRDRRFFIKDYIKTLEKGDTTTTSKKEPEKRHLELREYSIKYFHNYLLKNIDNLITNGSVGIIVPQILLNENNDSKEILDKLAEFLLSSEYNGQEHIVENATAHFVLKHIVTDDVKRFENGVKTFTEALLENSNSGYMKSWCKCNRGCFLLVKIFETCKEANKQKDVLIKLFAQDKDLLKTIKNEKTQGAKILLQKLNEIK